MAKLAKYKTKLDETQILIEEDALTKLFASIKEEVEKIDGEASYSSSDFRNSEVGKEKLQTFFKETKKYIGESEEENDQDEDKDKVEESLSLQNLVITDAIIESMISIASLYKGKECSFDVYAESKQGDKALNKYLKEVSKLYKKNIMKEAEEEIKTEEEDPLDNMTEEEKEAIEKFTEAIASFIEEEGSDKVCPKCGKEPCSCENCKNESEGEAGTDTKTQDQLNINDLKGDGADGKEGEAGADAKKLSENFFKKFVMSPLGTKTLKECSKSLKSVLVKLSESKLSKTLSNTSEIYAKVLSESVEESIKKSPLVKLGTLNEAQSKELTSLVSTTLNEMTEGVTKKLKEEMIENCENYINAEVLPSIMDSFDNKYVPSLKEEMVSSVNKYINYIAEQIAEDLGSKGLLVKTKKAEQLADFTESMLALIKDKLTIIPEQEDEMVRLSKRNEELKSSLTEAKVENAKMANRITDLRKENYVISALPEKLSEATKEKLLGYAQDVLWEACDDDIEKFKEEFDKACDEAEAIEKNEEEDLEKSESLKKKFAKKESECGDCDQKKEEDPKKDSEPKNEEDEKEDEKDQVNEWLKQALSLGGINEEEDPEKVDEEEDEKVEEEDEKEPIEEKFKRLGKKSK